MRKVYFETKNEDVQEKLLQSLFLLIRKGKYMKEFLRGDITVRKYVAKGKYYVTLAIAAWLDINILIEAFSTDDDGEQNPYVRMDTEIFEDGLILPHGATLIMKWDEDELV